MTFDQWLEAERPGVVPTPMQREWIDSTLAGRDVVWAGGMASGHTFAFHLVADYLKAADASSRKEPS